MGTSQNSNSEDTSEKSKYGKMTKKQLLDVLNRMNDDIKGYKEQGNIKELKRARKDRLIVKKLFHECDVCKHAQFKTTIDDKGFELERLIGICHYHECPYHDQFVEIANKAENAITETLQRMLED